MTTPRQLSPAEQEAITAFAAKHGRTWKDKLASVYWYNARVWDGRNCLHALRNDPAWGHAGLAAFRLPSIKTTRFNVTVRRIATGCDFHISLFAKDEATACDRAKDRARLAERISRAKMATLDANGIAVFRVVCSAVSPDQSRPIA